MTEDQVILLTIATIIGFILFIYFLGRGHGSDKGMTIGKKIGYRNGFNAGEESNKLPEDEYIELQAKLAEVKAGLKEAKTEEGLQLAGMYEPTFSFDSSERYKIEIKDLKAEQSAMIKNKTALTTKAWEVSGSRSEGKKMVNNLSKLILRAFNGDCDAAIAKVSWSNYETTKTRINRSFDQINVMGAPLSIYINRPFLNLKIKELAYEFELEEIKYKEREEQKEIREQMQEEARAQKEAEKALKDAAQEEARWQKALALANKEANLGMSEALAEKIKELTAKLEEATGKKARAISLAELTKVGHVYVISNEGSFGKGIYKVGMTRRLDPIDRINELGGASVPFRFDIHAMIYSEDAPALEKALHKVMTNNRVNKVNSRKEFFKIDINKIENAAIAHGAKVEFTKLAEAREFRESND